MSSFALLTEDDISIMLSFTDLLTLGTTLVALGTAGSSVATHERIAQAEVGLIDVRLSQRILRALSPGELVIVNDDIDDWGGVVKVARRGFPFEARKRFLAGKAHALRRVRKSTDACSQAMAGVLERVLVHDMAFCHKHKHEEETTILSVPDTSGGRSVFAITRGISNMCDVGCFCAGGHERARTCGVMRGPVLCVGGGASREANTRNQPAW